MCVFSPQDATKVKTRGEGESRPIFCGTGCMSDMLMLHLLLHTQFSIKKKILECLENDTMLNIMSVNLCQRTLNFKQQNRKEVFQMGKIENE